MVVAGRKKELSAVSAVLQVKSLDVFNEIMTRRAYAETCKYALCSFLCQLCHS